MIQNFLSKTLARNFLACQPNTPKRFYTKEELLSSFTQPKLFLRPLTFLSNDNAISLNLLKAKYGFKKEYITVIKNGSVIIEFIPLTKDEFGKVLFNVQDKKKFLLDLNRIGDV